MNSFIAKIFGILNAFLIFFLIIGGAIFGYQFNFYFADLLGFPVSGIWGLVIGLVIGVSVAVLVCGMLAIFISMRNELVEIRRLLDR